MANSKSNVVVGKPMTTGGVVLAPLGTTEPTDGSSDLGASFVRAGYVSSDGVEREEKLDTDTIAAWGGDTVVVVKKGTTVTVAFSFLEYLNKVAQGAIYGDANVTATPATTTAGNKLEISGKVDLSPHKVMVLELVSGDARGRVIFHDAQITDRDKYSYKDDDTAARNVTWTIFPDESGEYFHEHWDDGQKAAA